MDRSRVAPETWSERTKRDPGDEVANDGGQANLSREESTHKRIAQGDSDVDQEWEVVHGLRQNIPYRAKLRKAPDFPTTKYGGPSSHPSACQRPRVSDGLS
jgi:hypothetical protein